MLLQLAALVILLSRSPAGVSVDVMSVLAQHCQSRAYPLRSPLRGLWVYAVEAWARGQVQRHSHHIYHQGWQACCSPLAQTALAADLHSRHKVPQTVVVTTAPPLDAQPENEHLET